MNTNQERGLTQKGASQNQQSRFTPIFFSGQMKLLLDSPISKSWVVLRLFSECLDSAFLHCTCATSKLAHQKIDVISRHCFCMWVGFYICRLSHLLHACLSQVSKKMSQSSSSQSVCIIHFISQTQACVRQSGIDVQLLVWVNQHFVLPCS